MNPNQVRLELIAAYPYSNKWRRRVERMEDDQAIAIYIRLKKAGRIK